MHKLLDNTERIAEIMAASSYTISGTLIVSDWLSIIDAHAAAIGVIGGTLTFIANIIFKYLHFSLEKEKIEADKEEKDETFL